VSSEPQAHACLTVSASENGVDGVEMPQQGQRRDSRAIEPMNTGLDSHAQDTLSSSPHAAAAPIGRVGERGNRAGQATWFTRGNTESVVTTEHAELLWRQHEALRREIVEALVRDAGHPLDDAPAALRMAAESAAQAVLVRDSAYQRIAEMGGPLATSGRARRCFVVWASAVDRLEKHLRLIGLTRKPRPVPSLQDWLNGQADAEPDAPATDATSTTSSSPTDAGDEGAHE
jgi:hypothetical protein